MVDTDANVAGLHRVDWAHHAKQLFMHPPTFRFSDVSGAVNYRLRVSHDARSIGSIESRTPAFETEQLWAQLSARTVYDANVQAIGTRGEILGETGFSFQKKSSFSGRSLPQRCEYRAAGANYAIFVVETLAGRRKELRTYSIKPDGESGWPGLFYSAQIRLLVAYAKHCCSGDDKVALSGARTFVDWLVQHSYPQDWQWSSCPPTQEIHPIDYVLQPSRLGLIGDALLDFVDVTGDRSAFEKALKIAEALEKNQHDDGRWPFRVNGRSGETIIDYTSDQIGAARFLDRLVRDYQRDEFSDAVDHAVKWTLDNPCTNFRWEGQYDDMAGFEPYHGLEWYDTGFVIMYLLHHIN